MVIVWRRLTPRGQMPHRYEMVYAQTRVRREGYLPLTPSIDCQKELDNDDLI